MLRLPDFRLVLEGGVVEGRPVARELHMSWRGRKLEHAAAVVDGSVCDRFVVDADAIVLLPGFLSFGRFRPEVEKVAEADIVPHAGRRLSHREALEFNRYRLAVEDVTAVPGEGLAGQCSVRNFTIVVSLFIIRNAVEGEDALSVFLKVAHDVGV